jgi:hypothetical protein
MRAVVVCESVYGNTHRVADAVGAGLARQLRAHGCVVVAKPASFLVRRGNQLEPEETARARAWGARLAAGITPG